MKRYLKNTTPLLNNQQSKYRISNVNLEKSLQLRFLNALPDTL